MRKKWTEAENELIRLHYPDKKTDDIVCFFTDRTARVIQQHAAAIGVKKSDAFMKSPLSGRISKDNDIGKNTRFNSLTGGWNKGMRQSDYMSPEMIARTAKNRFKKGQDPHNTVSIGHERVTVDGYIEVKVRHVKNGDKNKNFELKHRLVWIENFGPIPEGFMVGFKDGDSLNILPENLELKSKKENLEQNFQSDSAIVKRMFRVKEPEVVAEIIKEIPAVIELKRKTILLNQKINKKDAKQAR